MELRKCPAGTATRVRWVDLEGTERDRLRELGVREGALVHVIHCGAFGGRVIAVGSDRFAIDGKTCACIDVFGPDEMLTAEDNPLAATATATAASPATA
ncbi:MAG: ferrous iron transport protein A [Cellulomonadaceae bacterium]|jgi:ferrous iron transport protein A|nr:ferrous iron transport protein A [Cellulomonadaceae bacterium]